MNVLLTADGRAKIADLGSAKYQERSVLSSLSVQFNQFAAFPPESMFFARTARSYRWDVWQLGAGGGLARAPCAAAAARRAAQGVECRPPAPPLNRPALPLPSSPPGALLWEMLCLELWDPAQSDTPEAYEAKLEGLLKNFLLPRGAPRALAELVIECLQWEPRARPSTAALYPRLLAVE